MNEAISYLNSLGIYKIKPGLERIKKVLSHESNPQDNFKSVLIAGTNGKGSVAHFVSSMLRSRGFKIGLYTSPHLISIPERIKVDEREISCDDLSRLILKIRYDCFKHINLELTYFEILTAVAFNYFAEQNVDYAVVETGMGGKWDATNVVNPIVSVITNVQMDHTDYLGKSINDIALEKSGIIKRGIPVVTGAKGSSLEILYAKAIKVSAPVETLGVSFGYEGENTGDFTYKGPTCVIRNLKLCLDGLYQLENASVAISTIENIRRYYGVDIRDKHIRDGLSNTFIEGRMEIIRSKPIMVLDGAHNPDAMCALRLSLKHTFSKQKFLFLISMMDNKDHRGFINNLSAIAEKLIITHINSAKCMKADKLGIIAKKIIGDVEIVKDCKEAYYIAKESNLPLCITGSLYLIGAIKQIIQTDLDKTH